MTGVTWPRINDKLRVKRTAVGQTPKQSDRGLRHSRSKQPRAHTYNWINDYDATSTKTEKRPVKTPFRSLDEKWGCTSRSAAKRSAAQLVRTYEAPLPVINEGCGYDQLSRNAFCQVLPPWLIGFFFSKNSVSLTYSWDGAYPDALDIPECNNNILLRKRCPIVGYHRSLKQPPCQHACDHCLSLLSPLGYHPCCPFQFQHTSPQQLQYT